MPALRKCLKHPGFYLLVGLAFAGLIALDASRAPQKQASARAYLGVLHAYRKGVSPAIGGVVRCRFEPSCSRYSEEAVRRYGIAPGLRLTVARLWRCRARTPPATPDPVP